MAGARSQFGTKAGFILSGIGGAVGLGNIWRFPQLTSENGGAAFVFVYVPLLIVIGVPLLWAELSIGQRAQRSPVAAFGDVAGRAWRWVGVALLASVVVFMSYYTVLAGLGLKYVLFAGTAEVFEDPSGFLARSTEGRGALVMHGLVTAATAVILSFGVAKGLERANLVMMPALFAIIVGLALYALFQPGAGAGVRFYLEPDLSAVDIQTVQLALGQVFFSVGIGFGLMLTYASYTPRGRSMFPSATTIAFSDLGVALVAGLMIFPLAFSQGLQGQVVSENATQTTALFLTMPSAFANIGGGLGRLLLAGFFLMLTFAAFSSTIAGLEVVVGYFVDTFEITRWKAATLAALTTYGIGIWAALSVEMAGRMDLLLGSVLLFAGGIGLCLVYAFGVKDRVTLLLGDDPNGSPFVTRVAQVFSLLIAYVIPVVLFVIFVLGLPGTWDALVG